MICKQFVPKVDAGHLRQHGYTLARYARVFGMPRPFSPTRSRTSVGSLTDPHARSEFVEAVAMRLIEDKVWMACISDEVGERMMNGPLRQRLSWMLTSMLAQRATVHGQALAVLSGALTELQEEWRTAQGGPDGGPTDSATLLAMVEKAGKLVRESEDAVQRTIKLALEEQRAESQWADSAGPTLYRGDAEKLDMPPGVTTGDREVIRNLLSMVGKHAARANTLDVEGSPLPPGAPSPQGGPTPPPSPDGENASTSSRRSPADEETPSTSLAAGDPLPLPPPRGATPTPQAPASSRPTRARSARSGSVSDPTTGGPTPSTPGPTPGADAISPSGINDSEGGPSRSGGTPRGASNLRGNLAASRGSWGAFGQCQAATKAGHRCKRWAVDDDGRCKQHKEG